MHVSSQDGAAKLATGEAQGSQTALPKQRAAGVQRPGHEMPPYEVVISGDSDWPWARTAGNNGTIWIQNSWKVSLGNAP